MNKKIIISIIIFILFGLSLFFLIKQKSVVQPSTTTDNGQKLLGPTLEEVVFKVAHIGFINVSSSWKLYSSKTLGIKLFYPNNVNYKESSSGVIFYFDNPENKALEEGKTYVTPDGGVNISNHLPPSLDIVKIKSSALPLEIKKYCEQYGVSCKSTTYLGNVAEVSTWEAAEMGDIIYFLNGTNLYQISINYGLPDDEVRATYYQIISTLKFLK